MHDGDDAGVEVVRLGFEGVEDLHREGPAGDRENGAVEEEGGELLGVERGRGHHQLEVGPPLDCCLQQAKQHVRVDAPLVRLSDDRV